jgi:hypothetical protein
MGGGGERTALVVHYYSVMQTRCDGSSSELMAGDDAVRIGYVPVLLLTILHIQPLKPRTQVLYITLLDHKELQRGSILR